MGLGRVVSSALSLGMSPAAEGEWILPPQNMPVTHEDYLAKGNQELSRLRKSSLPSLPLPNSHWKEGLYHKEKYYQRWHLETGGKGLGTTFKRMTKLVRIQHKLFRTSEVQDGGRCDFQWPLSLIVFIVNISIC